jgi:transcriptional regulator with XRE-family HTH domain
VWVRGQNAVGAALAAARKRARLTQTDVAKLLCKPQSFVSNYEQGQRRIDVLELVRISKALKAKPADVLADVQWRLRARPQAR